MAMCVVCVEGREARIVHKGSVMSPERRCAGCLLLLLLLLLLLWLLLLLL
jgi:hypothetical protein